MPRTRDPNKPKRNVFKDPSAYGTYDGPRGHAAQWAGLFGENWDAKTCKTIIKDESPWDILGIKAGVAWDEIKAAYRNLCKQHHPDVGGDPELCRKIIAAYKTLEESQK
jgi:DnaJ-class molecular chaperone